MTGGGAVVWKSRNKRIKRKREQMSEKQWYVPLSKVAGPISPLKRCTRNTKRHACKQRWPPSGSLEHKITVIGSTCSKRNRKDKNKFLRWKLCLKKFKWKRTSEKNSVYEIKSKHRYRAAWTEWRTDLEKAAKNKKNGLFFWLGGSATHPFNCRGWAPPWLSNRPRLCPMATSQAFSVEYRLMGVLYTDGWGGTRTGGEEEDG